MYILNITVYPNIIMSNYGKKKKENNKTKTLFFLTLVTGLVIKGLMMIYYFL